MATLSISASAAVCLPVRRSASTTRSQPRVASRRAPFVSNGNIKRTTAMLVRHAGQGPRCPHPGTPQSMLISLLMPALNAHPSPS